MPSIVDTADLTRSKANRRLFFLTSVSGLFALLGLRFIAVPWFFCAPMPDLTAIVGSVLDSLVVAVCASIAVGGLLYWLGATDRLPAEMRVIEPREIAETLDGALESTTEWWYRGHTGRHLRSKTLPALAKSARHRNQSVSVYIQILDPLDDSVCKFYADYRRGLRTANGETEWTSDRVRHDLYATVLAAYEIAGREPLLDISLALHRTVSVYRVDLSSRLAIITKEDPREPALRCDAGTFFHASYREDLKMARQQGKELDRRVRIASFERLSSAEMREFYKSINLYSSFLDDDSRLVKIRDLARCAENPYS